jgi:potassium-dependent mechanosensitive channel
LARCFGLRGKSLELAGGIARLTLFLAAAFLVKAPWGFQSTDVPIDFGAVGFKIGDITISLSSVMIAIFIFGIAYAVMRAVQEWLDKRLLPHTTLDPGLRNSIMTSIPGHHRPFAWLSGAKFRTASIVNNFVCGLILL